MVGAREVTTGLFVDVEMISVATELLGLAVVVATVGPSEAAVDAIDEAPGSVVAAVVAAGAPVVSVAGSTGTPNNCDAERRRRRRPKTIPRV